VRPTGALSHRPSSFIRWLWTLASEHLEVEATHAHFSTVYLNWMGLHCINTLDSHLLAVPFRSQPGIKRQKDLTCIQSHIKCYSRQLNLHDRSFCGFLHSFQEYDALIPDSHHDVFLRNSLRFIFFFAYQLTVWGHIFWAT
jgi:hypothetical protein